MNKSLIVLLVVLSVLLCCVAGVAEDRMLQITFPSTV